MTGSNIIDQLDTLLKNNQLDTRAGLYFLGELVKDAFKYIEEQKAGDTQIAETLKSFSVRVGNVESGLNEFLKKREKEQEKAEDERKFYRRTVVSGIIMLVLSQVVQFIIQFWGSRP